MLPLDEVRTTLAGTGGRYGFLSNVADDEVLRSEARTLRQRLDTYATAVGFREELFAALSDYAQQCGGGVAGAAGT